VNILFLSIEFNYCCGISRHIFSLSQELTKEGHNVILGANKGTLVDECVKAGINFYHVPIIPENKKTSNIIRCLIAIYKIVKDNKIDIIHSHHRWAEFLAWLISRVLAIPTITTSHALVSRKKRMSFRSNRIIAVSESVKQMLLIDFGVRQDRIRLIRNAPRAMRIPTLLELQLFKDFLGIKPDISIVTGVGRLHKEKGFDVLLEAVKLYENNRPPIHLVIIGKGEEKNNLMEYSMKHKLKTTFLDEISNIELAYGISSVICVPSRQESSGLVPLEASLFEKPVIVTNVGGLREMIVSPHLALTVSPDNPIQLYNSIKALLQNDALRYRYARALMKYVKKNYSRELMTSKTVNTYKELIGL